LEDTLIIWGVGGESEGVNDAGDFYLTPFDRLRASLVPPVQAKRGGNFNKAHFPIKKKI